jgi:Leucine-rich repeat (LRR) protein
MAADISDAAIAAALVTHRGNVELVAMEVLAAVKRTASETESKDKNPSPQKAPRPDALTYDEQRDLLRDMKVALRLTGVVDDWPAIEVALSDFEHGVLWLNKHNIVALPPGFGQLRELEELVLNNTLLTGIPDELGDLYKLKKLDLEKNSRLASIPDTLGNLQKLKQLLLNNNILTRLPETLGNLLNLKVLNVSHNLLEVLPSTLGDLKNLTRLDCSNNKLTRLPETLGKLKKVTDLDCSNNQLTQLPIRLGFMRKLETLKANDNNLTEVPKELSKLRLLRHLGLKSNDLRRLPLDLRVLKHLWTIQVDNNPNFTGPSTLKDLEQAYRAGQRKLAFRFVLENVQTPQGDDVPHDVAKHLLSFVDT